MDFARYPATPTIKAFGGFTRMHEVIGAPIPTIANWERAKGGLIPRWWTPIITKAAEERGLQIPKPVKRKKPRAA